MKRVTLSVVYSLLYLFNSVDVMAASNANGNVWDVHEGQLKGVYDEITQLSFVFNRATLNGTFEDMLRSFRQIRAVLQKSQINLNEEQTMYMNWALLNISIEYLLYAMKSKNNVSKAKLDEFQTQNINTILSILKPYGVEKIHIQGAFAFLSKLFSLYNGNINPSLLSDAIKMKSGGFFLFNMRTIYWSDRPENGNVAAEFFGDNWFSERYIREITPSQKYVVQPKQDNPYAGFQHFGQTQHQGEITSPNPYQNLEQIYQTSSQIQPESVYQPQQMQVSPKITEDAIRYLKSSGVYSMIENLVQSVIDIPVNNEGKLARTLDVSSLNRNYIDLLSQHPELINYFQWIQFVFYNLLQTKLNLYKTRGMPKNDALYMMEGLQLLNQVMATS